MGTETNTKAKFFKARDMDRASTGLQLLPTLRTVQSTASKRWLLWSTKVVSEKTTEMERVL